MTYYAIIFFGIAIGAGAGLAFVVFVQKKDKNYALAALVGAVLGGALGGIAYNVILYASSGKNVIEITSETQFEQVVLQSDKPVLVDFYSNGCGPCLRMMPVVGEIADEGVTSQGKRYVVVKIDVDANTAWFRKYFKGNGVPYFAVYKNGQAVAESRGAQPKESLMQVLNPHLD